MEYEDFAAQFRERTSMRLMEFEKALERAEQEMNRAAQTGPAATSSVQGVQKRKPPHAVTRVRGPVQSVLRRPGATF